MNGTATATTNNAPILNGQHQHHLQPPMRQPQQQQQIQPSTKPPPPPTGTAPPAPAAAPPVPPSGPATSGGAGPPTPVQTQTQPPKQAPMTNGSHPHPHPHPQSQTQPHPQTHTHSHGHSKGKKKSEPTPVDPAVMYESLKSRIAALEEEEVHEEEEERQFAEEAQTAVKGMSESAIHSKYIELFAEFKRLERDHSKEKQKLTKDKDAAKGQLTKANATKTKMENLARELQKDNKRLREDTKRLAQSVEDAQDEIMQMKSDVAKRIEKAKQQDVKYRETPDIVIKVVCRYRAELFFKISRKTKLSRLFNAWTERMETGSFGSAAATTVSASSSSGSGAASVSGSASGKSKPASTSKPTAVPNESVDADATLAGSMQFIFTHSGRTVEAEQSPEEAGIEDGDEVLAIEMMDLTDAGTADDADTGTEVQLQKLRKEWTEEPEEAKRTLEEVFNGVVRERLKDVLRQYELRERHFECVIRSKELEVLLSRARAAEQKQLSEGEASRADRLEEEASQLRKDLEESQNGQTMLIDKLIHCCKEFNAEKTQRLLASLREELEKRGISSSDGFAGGT